jgi:UDP-N-acetylmuramyl pentapeptide synthase
VRTRGALEVISITGSNGKTKSQRTCCGVVLE